MFQFLNPNISYLLQINEEEASLFDMLWLLLASVIFVPIFQKIPGGKWHLCICTLTPEVVMKKGINFISMSNS